MHLDSDTTIEEQWLEGKVKSETEHVFTSTGSKLLLHPERLRRFRDQDEPTPIVMHIMPTDVCNFSCTFCSVGNRSGYKNAVYQPGSKPDVLQLEQIKYVVDYLCSKGLEAVILSGGGEPTIYKDDSGNNFADLIRYLRSKNLQIGLITNGSMLNRWEELIKELTWVRVSVYPPQYTLDVIKLPEKIPEGTTLGFSWIFAFPPDKDPAEVSETEILEVYDRFSQSIQDLALKKGVKYIRLFPDCHTYGSDFIKLHNAIDKLVDKYGKPFFQQHKIHKASKKCYIGYFHPVLYPDGYVYPCDSLVLNDNIARKFKQEYAMCRWDEIRKLYEGPVRSLIKDTNKMCPKCVFNSNNTLLNDIYEGKMPIPERSPSNTLHRSFI